MSILRATVNLLIQVLYLLEAIGKLGGIAWTAAMNVIFDCDHHLSRE